MQIASTHLDLRLGSSMFLMPIVLQTLHIIRCPAQCTRVGIPTLRKQKFTSSIWKVGLMGDC
jgi:hypothetical protein